MPQIKGHGLLTHLKDNQPKRKLIDSPKDTNFSITSKQRKPL